MTGPTISTILPVLSCDPNSMGQGSGFQYERWCGAATGPSAGRFGKVPPQPMDPRWDGRPMKSPYGRGWNATNVPRPGRKCPAFGTGFSREAAKNRGISPAGTIVDCRPPADGPRELAPGSPRMEEYDGHAPLWFSVSTRPRRLTRPDGRSCVQGSGDTSDIVPRYQRPHDRGRISVAGWGTPLKSFAERAACVVSCGDARPVVDVANRIGHNRRLTWHSVLSSSTRLGKAMSPPFCEAILSVGPVGMSTF
jgi:hypothetical protein